MFTLNSKQKTTAVFLLASLATIFAFHNPSEGYVTDHLESGGPGTYQWEVDRSGCTPQLQAELEGIEKEALKHAFDSRALMKHIGNPRRRDIYEQCMSHHQSIQNVVEHPFLSWERVSRILCKRRLS